MGSEQERIDTVVRVTADDESGDRTWPGTGETYKDTGVEDPAFATPHEGNPFAADDLQQQAAQAPRTDKQGDVQPSS